MFERQEVPSEQPEGSGLPFLTLATYLARWERTPSAGSLLDTKSNLNLDTAIPLARRYIGEQAMFFRKQMSGKTLLHSTPVCVRSRSLIPGIQHPHTHILTQPHKQSVHLSMPPANEQTVMRFACYRRFMYTYPSTY